MTALISVPSRIRCTNFRESYHVRRRHTVTCNGVHPFLSAMMSNLSFLSAWSKGVCPQLSAIVTVTNQTSKDSFRFSVVQGCSSLPVNSVHVRTIANEALCLHGGSIVQGGYHPPSSSSRPPPSWASWMRKIRRCLLSVLWYTHHYPTWKPSSANETLVWVVWEFLV